MLKALAAALFPLLALGSFALPAAAEDEPTLWLADAAGLFEVRRSDQAVITEVPATLDARAVAVDRQLGLVWTVAGGMLQAILPDGLPLFQILLELGAGTPVCLEVDEDDGSAWFAAGDTVEGYASWGELQHEVSLGEPILDLVLSPADGRLWVVHARSVVALDRSTGRREVEISLPRVTSASVNPVTGEVWVATPDALLLYSPEGEELLSTAEAGLEKLVAESDGALWALQGEAVVRLDELGEETSRLVPFRLPSAPQRLKRDAATGGLWVASEQAVQRISPAGWVQEAVDLSTAAQLRDVAPGRSLLDEEGPELVIEEPADGSSTEELRPALRVSWADAGAGVDPSSLFFEAEGSPLEVSCSAEPGGALCTLLEDLPSGEVRLGAFVADFLANPSPGAQVVFTVTADGGGQNVDDPPTDPNTSPTYFTAAPVDRGMTANQVYVTDADIETINPATGNLTLSIPLGQVYTVGPKISYQFRLHHNSHLWQEVKIPCTVPAQHRPDYCDGDLSRTFNVSVPNPNSNAGLGWELHLGKLYAPTPPAGLDELEIQRFPNSRALEGSVDATWLYVAPDGASHQFHQLLDRPAGAHYTVDGSYLRLRMVGSDLVRVDHPDGRISEFEKTDAFEGTQFCGGGVSGCWRLKRIFDPYNNYVTVSYQAVTGQGLERWIVRDATGRTHEIDFLVTSQWTGGGDGTGVYVTAHPADPTTPGRMDEWGDLRRSLRSVKLAAFGGSVLQLRPKYVQEGGPPTEVDRGRMGSPDNQGAGVPTTLRTRILREVAVENLPAGDEFAFLFETHSSPAQVSGMVSQVQLPSHGQLRYEYGNWSFPTACIYRSPTIGGPDVPLRTYRFGVKKKIRRPRNPAAGEGQIGTWTYTNALFADGPLVDQGPDCSREHYRRTLVDGPPRPGGRFVRQVFYNSVTEGPRTPRPTDPIDSWQVTDHGLPLTKKFKRGTAPSNYLFLSREVRDCPPGTAVGGEPGDCALQTETWVRYASEFRTGCYQILGNSPECWKANAVKERELTVYHDDGQSTRTVTSSRLNGLGSFRQRDEVTSWAGPVTEKMDHLSGRRTGAGGFEGLVIDAATGYVQVGNPASYTPAPGQAWVLGEYSYRSRKEGTTTYRTDYEFDGKGSIICQRRRQVHHSYSPTDVVVSYDLGGVVGTDAGLVTQEIHAGGDAGNLSTSDLCATNGTWQAGSRFVVDHGYQDLQRAWSRVPDTAGQSFPYLFRVTVDPNTGLPSREFTVSDQHRALHYDVLSRLTSVVPEASLGEASTVLAHHNPTGSNASTTVLRRMGGVTLTWEKLTFDDLGRLRQREMKRPGHVGAVPDGSTRITRSATAFYADGTKRYETTRQDPDGFDTEKRSEILRYDPFGQPTKVRNAYGHVTDHVYFGERKVESTTYIATQENPSDGGLAGQTPQTTRQILDTSGRVVELFTPAWTQTTTYDPAGNPTHVSRAGQQRLFTYDGRGFLVSEELPELGSSNSVSGRIDYRRDVLGNVRRKSGSGWHLEYKYDPAFRLTRVEDALGEPWAEYVYGTANNPAAGNYPKGKLVRATRTNRPLPGAGRWVVAEEYGYKGALGQLSSKKTQLEFPDNPPGQQIGDVFSQSWLYDSLGRVFRTVYPACVSALCNDGPGDRVAPAHHVDMTYVEGLATKTSSSLGISGVYTYHDNLQLRTAQYNNGTSMEYNRGTNGMAIPSRLRMVSNDRQETKWDSGLYRYDGALNVRKIGDELFAYDGVSRLKSATLRARWGLGGPYTTHTESYTYDPWDNLTNRWRDGVLSSYTYQLGAHQHKNRLLRTPGYTGATPDVLYDTRGHVTQQGLLAGQPHQQMAWDPLGMQSEHREARADGSSTHHFFLYGPGNLRFLTGIQEHPAGGPPGAIRREIDLRNQGGKVLRRWIVNGWGSGQNTVHDRDYVYDQTGPLATRLGDAQATRRYFFKDHLGTTRVVTNQHGQPDFGYQSYYPFGEEIHHPLSQTEDRLCKFTGHEREPHGHAHYMLGRHYAQNLQRFLSPDPARDGWNLYGYAAANPVKYVDPNGNWVETAWDIANIAVGIGSLVDNVRKGNAIAAALDVGGILLDTAAAATPLIPGGAGAAIKATRAVDLATDAATTAKVVDTSKDAAKAGKAGSRAERREVMRREGIPTSKQPQSQSSPRGPGNTPAGRQLVYDTDDGQKLVQHQLQDRNHGPHWEAGSPKPGGQTDPAGRPRLRNDKTRLEEEPR